MRQGRPVTIHAALPSLPSVPAAAGAGGFAPIAMLLVATLALGALQAVPRADEPVMLVFPPRIDADRAVIGVLAVTGWAPVSLWRFGPVTIAVAAPAAPDADLATLRRDAGAWLGLRAFGRGGCAGRTALPPS